MNHSIVSATLNTTVFHCTLHIVLLLKKKRSMGRFNLCKRTQSVKNSSTNKNLSSGIFLYPVHWISSPTRIDTLLISWSDLWLKYTSSLSNSFNTRKCKKFGCRYTISINQYKTHFLTAVRWPRQSSIHNAVVITYGGKLQFPFLSTLSCQWFHHESSEMWVNI